MAEPLASFEGFEAFEGQFRATRKKGFPEPTVCATPPTVSHRAQSPQSSKCEVLERLKRPESRSWLLQRPVWQNHWQGSRGLRGFRGLRGLRRLKGSFGPLEKKDLARQSPEPTVCATPPTVSHRAQSPQSSKCEVLERLKRPESRSWLLQRPVWQSHWQGSRGLRGFRGLRGLRDSRRLKGSCGPLEKKDLARQSPEPTVCATPPIVSHRAQSPQSSKCEVLERLKRPESRSWLLQRPVWQNHWQGSRGLRGFRGLRGLRGFRGLRGLRGLRRLKGNFGPLEKKDLARQSSNGQYGRTIGKVRGV